MNNMKIDSTKNIKTLQEEFRNKFPGLSLSISAKRHSEHEGSNKEFIYDSDTLLANTSSQLKEGEIYLDPSKLVKEFEQEMRDNHGLHVQVKRKSNKIWLQTISTDHWTLGEQNRKGIHSQNQIS